MIPEDKKQAVERGLREAFGVTEFEDIRQLTEGLSSALIFRIVVRGTPYLLARHHTDRCDGRPDATLWIYESRRGCGACAARLVHEH